MRINQYVALATGMSRRQADRVIAASEVTLNGKIAEIGSQVSSTDRVALKGQLLSLEPKVTVLFNKPVGYVCSRNGQGSKTIYELLPKELRNLKPVGRLDKESSGLLLLTNDGQLGNQLTHPSFGKQKIYEVVLDKDLTSQDQHKIEQGVQLEDGLSKLKLEGTSVQWTITMQEGRNRQIRRTFGALNHKVIKLHRTHFGPYKLDVPTAQWRVISTLPLFVDGS